MSLANGSMLGHYEVIRLLGKGGMGEVYKARDTRLGRDVAVKVLPEEFAHDPERLARFEREAKAVAALNHPNILSIYDFGKEGDTAYAVTELLEGETLRDRLSTGALPVRKAVEYAAQIAKGLAAAHDKGIVHRDLKPENLFVTKDGHIKILDFGLAAYAPAPDSRDTKSPTLTRQTEPGTLMGTVGYMSPEQVRGMAADQRSDIFSLGAVLYEMVSGQRAFDGESQADVLSAILKEDPPELKISGKPVPAQLDHIVRTCLEKRPEDRFSSAHDLALALEAMSGAEPAASSARTHAIRPRRWTLFAGAAAVAVLLLSAIVLAASYLVPWKANRAKPFEHVRVSRLTHDGSAANHAAISPDGRYVTYRLYDEHKRPSLWVQQSTTQSAVRLVPASAEQLDFPVFSPDGNYIYYCTYPADRMWSQLYRMPVLGGVPEALPIQDVDTPISFSPDGKRIAYAATTRASLQELRLAHLDGSRVEVLAVSTASSQFPCWVGRPDWSPDGSTLAWVRLEGDKSYIQLVDVRTGAMRPLGDRRWDAATEVEWMPDGRGLLAVALDRSLAPEPQIWLVDCPSGSARPLTSDLGGYSSIGVSADGRSLVSVRTEVRSSVWVAPYNEPQRATQVTSGYDNREGAAGLAWTPAGGLLYTSAAGGTPDLWLQDKPGDKARRLTNNPMAELHPQISPDGRTIVFDTTTDEGSGAVWRMDADGSALRQLSPGPIDYHPLVTKDGRWVLYSSLFPTRRQLRVPIEGGTSEAPCGGDPEKAEIFDRFMGWALSPDGLRLAGWFYGGKGFVLSTVPLDGNEPRQDLSVPCTNSGLIQWAPDGRSVLYYQTWGPNMILQKAPDKTGPMTYLDVKGDKLFWFAVSPDGKQFACSRGAETSDVVLLEQAKPEP